MIGTAAHLELGYNGWRSPLSNPGDALDDCDHLLADTVYHIEEVLQYTIVSILVAAEKCISHAGTLHDMHQFGLA